MNKTFAVFANGGTMTTAQTALWQYDYGQILVVQGIELPNAYEVQFCNAGDSTTITSVGDSTGVVIPDQFLQNGETIYAYIYLHTGNTDGETEYKITIPVMDRAEPTDIEPTPAQESTIGQLIDALNAGVEAAEEAAEKGPQIIDGYWFVWDADAGEYVNTNVKAEGEDGEPGTPGADGSNAWMIDVQYTNTVGTTIRAQTEHLIGPPNARPMYGDILFVSDGRFGNITSPGTRITQVSTLGDLHGDPGEDGYSPVVTITEIDGGHRVTITDEDHPQGQSFDVMDGQGGSGSSDYNDLSNKPQIAGVTLSGDKSLADLGIAAASDIPTVPSAYTSTPADLGTASAGSSTSWAKGDHVHKMPSAADVGAYALPSGGIPKSDLASAVQTSLGKADDALPASGNAYRTASIPMGELDSTSTATVMTAQVDGITELRDGVCVWLKNGVVKSASGVTLNINSLGAKPIYNSLSGAVVTTTFTAASTYLFVYNSTRVTGGCWDMVYGYDTNTSYTPVTLGFGYATCSTAAATAAKTASLSSYTLTTGGIVAVKFTNAVGAGATLNINSKGAKAIYYKGAAITAGVIKAGDTVTMIYSTYYHILSIDRDEAPVTSVNGQTGAVTLSIPSTAADVGAIAAPANPSSAQDLVYLNGAWVAADKLYIVNCTPTALDYSGTMDKTVAQIYAAFQEGKTIVFRVWGGQDTYMDVVSSFNGSDGHAYPSFNAYLVYDSDNALIEIYTGTANEGTRATYGTFVYPLSTSACIPAPATPTTGDFLCWNGSSWAATSLSTWQGGNYGS